jgi:hypothetical protein
VAVVSESTRQRLIKKAQRLFAELENERRINQELREANANLRVERDAGDVLLGEAMDALTESRR